MEALAALRLWAYERTFPNVLGEHGHPRIFRIPPLPAADWLIASFESGHLSYLPGLLDDDERELLMDAQYEGHVSHDDLVQANRDALEVISGWPWWSAGKLMGVLYHQFDMVGGLLVMSGVDLQRQPLAAVLAAVNAKILEYKSTQDRTKWLNELAMPPADMLHHDNWNEEAAERALEMMMANGGAGYGDE